MASTVGAHADVSSIVGTQAGARDDAAEGGGEVLLKRRPGSWRRGSGTSPDDAAPAPLRAAIRSAMVGIAV